MRPPTLQPYKAFDAGAHRPIGVIVASLISALIWVILLESVGWLLGQPPSPHFAVAVGSGIAVYLAAVLPLLLTAN